MSAAQIRAAIVATMQTVADIGVVHNRERYIKDLSGLKTLYVPVGTSQLRGWFVRRQELAERDRILPRSIEYTRWRIQGVMAFDDANASELVFDQLIEDLRDAFRANDTLDGTVSQCALPDGSEAGLQLVEAGPVSFAGVICHGARLSLTTQLLR
ncbi:MAG: hypothetical protein J0H50_14860 [Xanthomonadales bacterium]|nr:hypothetical protein [Xanthomonadales bacterium]